MVDALDHVLALERELQTAACRADTVRLRELLADDFVEIGASGRHWSRDEILALLRDEGPDDAEIEVRDLTGRALGPGVLQLFWTSRRGDRQARRTSLWSLRDGRWQQVFHQGTPLPPA